MLIRNFHKPKVRLFIVLLLVAIILNATIRAVFLTSGKEIIYDYNMTMFYCKGGEKCSYFGHLSLANTGSKSISNIVISMREVTGKFRSNATVLNLSASAPRENDPVIKNDFSEDGNTTITIQDLSPGALVEIDLSGFSIHKKYQEVLEYNPLT